MAGMADKYRVERSETLFAARMLLTCVGNSPSRIPSDLGPSSPGATAEDDDCQDPSTLPSPSMPDPLPTSGSEIGLPALLSSAILLDCIITSSNTLTFLRESCMLLLTSSAAAAPPTVNPRKEPVEERKNEVASLLASEGGGRRRLIAHHTGRPASAPKPVDNMIHR